MSRSRKNDYLLLRDIIVDTYLEVYKIPIKLDPGMNFQHIKNVYNYLKKATNIDMKDFVRFTMDNWIVLMSKIASTSVQQNERMKVFHIGYFAAAVESFLIMYADKKDLIGYIPGDFRHNEVVDLVRKGLSKEDAEEKVRLKYNLTKPEYPVYEREKLIKENNKLKEKIKDILASAENRQIKDREQLVRLNLEIRELRGIIQKYRSGQLSPKTTKVGYRTPQVGDNPYTEVKNISQNKAENSLDILSNWHEADDARREKIRKTRQYITQHEMYEGFWSLLDSEKKEASS